MAVHKENSQQCIKMVERYVKHYYTLDGQKHQNWKLPVAKIFTKILNSMLAPF